MISTFNSLARLCCYLPACFLFIVLLPGGIAESYDLSGIDTTYNFGTIATPFPDITLTDGSICVGYTVIVESSSYYVRAVSSGSTSAGVFQLINGSNSAYKLNYSVSWAGTSGGTPTYVALASGQRSSTTFTAQLLGGLTCLLLPNNSTMQLKLLSADQILAKQGTYTDTLTITIAAS